MYNIKYSDSLSCAILTSSVGFIIQAKQCKPNNAGVHPPSTAVQSQQHTAGFIIQAKQCKPSSTVLAFSSKQSSVPSKAVQTQQASTTFKTKQV